MYTHQILLDLLLLFHLFHELALFLSISDDAVKQQIAKLVQKQFIRRVGPDKGGHWEVLEGN